MQEMTADRLAIHPLTPDRWDDLERLFGERGAVGGCWCMFWRLTRSQYAERSGEPNRAAFREIVEQGPPPGLLAYVDGEPAGWCAVGPRESYSALGRSRIFKPVDDQPAWAVTCFFVAKPYRRQGISSALLEAAVEFAAEHGATVVEGYPVDPTGAAQPTMFIHTGLTSTFQGAGFSEAARRSEKRPLMRYTVTDATRGA